jgi:hypothetical protein
MPVCRHLAHDAAEDAIAWLLGGGKIGEGQAGKAA